MDDQEGTFSIDNYEVDSSTAIEIIQVNQQSYTFPLIPKKESISDILNLVFTVKDGKIIGINVVVYFLTKEQRKELEGVNPVELEVSAAYLPLDNTFQPLSFKPIENIESHRLSVRLAPPDHDERGNSFDGIPLDPVFLQGGGGGGPTGSSFGVGSHNSSFGGNQGGYGGTGGPHGGGGSRATATKPIAIPNKIIIDDSFKNNSCLIAVYNKMGGSEAFTKYLNKFDKKMSVADLKFLTDENFSSNRAHKYHDALALTDPPYNSNLIEITFNTDFSTDGYIIEEPDVFKVVTLMHEVLHAEMYRKMLDALIASDPEASSLKWTTQAQFDAFLNSLKNKYFGIFYYYTRFDFGIPTDDEPNEWQHQQMAQHYRDVIIEVLTDYDPSLTAQEKEDLSWLGLNEANIRAWQNMGSREQRKIINRIKQIRENFENECH